MVGDTDPQTAPPADLNALALRLFGWLMLLGAGLLLLALAGILELTQALVGGQRGFVLPGVEGHHSIDAAVVPILAVCGGVLATLGLVSLWFSRHAPARHLPLPRRSSRRARRSVLVLLGGLAVLAIALLRR